MNFNEIHSVKYQRYFSKILVILFLLIGNLTFQLSAHEFSGKVVSVHDGDTLTVSESVVDVIFLFHFKPLRLCVSAS